MGKKRKSAGLLMFRRSRLGVEVFLVHPGGPLFARKDDGHWGIPKGEIESGEDPLEVAFREFAEETGQEVDVCSCGGKPIPLGSIRQKGGKKVVAWAFEGEWPEGVELESNLCDLEWPPRSGRVIQIPEVDDGRFFDLERARRKLREAQFPLVERLLEHLGE